MMSVILPTLASAKPSRLERAPDRRQVLDRDMRQDQVLLVAHPDLALAVGVGDVGHAFHLHRAGIARRRAGGLQRSGDDAIARHAMRRHVGLEPQREVAVFELQRLDLRPRGRPLRQRRRRELAGDRLDGLGRQLQRAVLDRGILGLDLLAHLLGADLVHQDLDARLVEVVAPAVAVVDAQRRLEIGEKLVPAAGTRAASCRSSACGRARRPRSPRSRPRPPRSPTGAGRCRAPARRRGRWASR